MTAAHARDPGVQKVMPHIVPLDFPPACHVASCVSVVRPQKMIQRIYHEKCSANDLLVSINEK